MPSKGTKIRQTYFFPQPPEVVFAALTDQTQLVKWFPRKAKFDPKTGGRFSFTWDGGYKLSGKVKKFSRNKRLVLSWPDVFEDGKEFKTQAELTFAAKDGGTLLGLEHSGFKKGKDWVQLQGDVRAGWIYFLTNLKSVLANGTDLRSRHDET